MLIYLSEAYTNYFSFLNLFIYITFRTGGAILTALFFSLIFGNSIINFLSSLQPIGQPIRDDGPERHIIEKSGTPTMGGVLILMSILISVLIWSDLENVFVWITLLSLFLFGLVGLIDDYKKVCSSNYYGLKVSTRIILQLIISLIIILLIYNFLPDEYNTILNLPFFKNFIFNNIHRLKMLC